MSRSCRNFCWLGKRRPAFHGRILWHAVYLVFSCIFIKAHNEFTSFCLGNRNGDFFRLALCAFRPICQRRRHCDHCSSFLRRCHNGLVLLLLQGCSCSIAVSALLDRIGVCDRVCPWVALNLARTLYARFCFQLKRALLCVGWYHKFRATADAQPADAASAFCRGYRPLCQI